MFVLWERETVLDEVMLVWFAICTASVWLNSSSVAVVVGIVLVAVVVVSVIVVPILHVSSVHVVVGDEHLHDSVVLFHHCLLLLVDFSGFFPRVVDMEIAYSFASSRDPSSKFVYSIMVSWLVYVIWLLIILDWVIVLMVPVMVARVMLDRLLALSNPLVLASCSSLNLLLLL